ncbi:Nramp family divalent metal transporter [Actinotalea sp.]|uniref:Nramp family divalent metal transporter n=1 Tax=Actinotalea sp. TaxID=1872145 RepID=UPI00356AC3B9
MSAPPTGPASGLRAGQRPSAGWSRLPRLLGPAFVAAVAYVDPGNVAANMTAGAQYGYLLLWVLVVSNAMAVLVQYLSARLGLVTGQSLPQLLGGRLRTGPRRAFWLQAEIVAAATDLAEVVGGALALSILFGTPLLLGGVIVGTVSMALLAVQSRRGQRPFERVVMGLLAVLTLGFLCGLFVDAPDWGAAAGGLVPQFAGTPTVVLAASMLGATVMPHAVYVHSALVRDRYDVQATAPGATVARPSGDLLRAIRWDVVLSLIIAGTVNIAMLLLAASSLAGVAGTDTLEGAHAAITASLGPVVGVAFGIALLASGLASTSVGCYAGATIMAGLLRIRVPLLLRRAITLVPALALLAWGADPTLSLVLSQVLLSLGIPFALIPLVRLCSDRGLMGSLAVRGWLRAAAWAVVAAVVALNVVLVGLTVLGG